MLRGRTLGVVMPAHCEEALIGRAIGEVPPFVDAIWVVDDGSTDETASAALGAGDPRVRLVRFDQNHGVGAAIRAGYEIAFSSGVDVACVMAGDAQMDGRDLETLVEPILEGEADYVVGDRLAWPAARAAMPPTRYLGNIVLSFLSRLTLGVPVGDSQCGYTALSREAAKAMKLETLWPRYGYPNDLLARAKQAGARVVTRPVRPVYGAEKSGVRLHHAILVIPFVLARAWVRARLDIEAGGSSPLPLVGREQPEER